MKNQKQKKQKTQKKKKKKKQQQQQQNLHHTGVLRSKCRSQVRAFSEVRSYTLPMHIQTPNNNSSFGITVETLLVLFKYDVRARYLLDVTTFEGNVGPSPISIIG